MSWTTNPILLRHVVQHIWAAAPQGFEAWWRFAELKRQGPGSCGAPGSSLERGTGLVGPPLLSLIIFHLGVETVLQTPSVSLRESLHVQRHSIAFFSVQRFSFPGASFGWNCSAPSPFLPCTCSEAGPGCPPPIARAPAPPQHR